MVAAEEMPPSPSIAADVTNAAIESSIELGKRKSMWEDESVTSVPRTSVTDSVSVTSDTATNTTFTQVASTTPTGNGPSKSSSALSGQSAGQPSNTVIGQATVDYGVSLEGLSIRSPHGSKLGTIPIEQMESYSSTSASIIGSGVTTGTSNGSSVVRNLGQNDLGLPLPDQRTSSSASADTLKTPIAKYFSSVRKNEFSQVKRWLREETPIARKTIGKAIDPEGHYLIHWASLFSDIDFLHYLIEYCDADVNVETASAKQTPLMWAITRQDGFKTLRYLLSRKDVDITRRDSLGVNAFVIAVQHSNLSAFFLLLTRDTTLATTGDNYGCTALHWAAFKGEESMVKMLHSYGYDFNTVDSQRMTPLHRAMLGCRTPIIEFLIKTGGANPTIKNFENLNPIELGRKELAPAICDIIKDHLEEVGWDAAALEKGQATSKAGNDHDVEMGNPVQSDVGNRNSNNSNLSMKKRIKKTRKQMQDWVLPVLAVTLMIYDLHHMIVFLDEGVESYSFTWFINTIEKFVIVLGLFLHFHCCVSDPGYASKESNGRKAVASYLRMLDRALVEHELQSRNPNHIGGNEDMSPSAMSEASSARGVFQSPKVSNYQNIGDIVSSKSEQELLESNNEANSGNDPTQLPPDVLFKFCETCQIMRDLRMKHCRSCDRCVHDFDHHCVWVNNCVGRGNHRSFVGFLLVLSISLPFAVLSVLIKLCRGLWGWSDYLKTERGLDADTLHFGYFTESFVAHYGWEFIYLMMNLGCKVGIFCLAQYQFHVIGESLTTNERMNAHRYKHLWRSGADGQQTVIGLWDTGSRYRNCIEFWCRKHKQSMLEYMQVNLDDEDDLKEV